MKKWLIEHLICPECVLKHNKDEFTLSLNVISENDEEILEGDLKCPQCGASYTIKQGIAVIVPQKALPHVMSKSSYNSQSMLNAYLWSHFSEFFNGMDATDAYHKWAGFFRNESGWALDIGCAVGRLSFELSKTHTWTVGIDTSFSFIQAARKLMHIKRLEFNSVVEGRITQDHACDLDPAYRFDATEFIIADATALPFRSNLFTTAASINILEKVPHPMRHLEETNRVLEKTKANFIFSDPFTWDEAVSHPDLWIGGRNSGPFAGRGMDNLCQLLKGESGVFTPGFFIQEKGDVHWKIRKTQHLYEHITSQFVIAERNKV